MPKKRKGKGKLLKPKLHIFCEGKKTEPIYLTSYLDRFHPNNRLIQIEKTNKNTPVELIEVAIKLKSDKDTPSNDRFWVVYDRESTSKYSDALHQKAIDNAKQNNIQIAFSNVCFEVWILLHFTKNTAPYSSFNNLLKNSKLNDYVKQLGLKKYNKSENQLFHLIQDKINVAKKNAEQMNLQIIKSSNFNENQPYKLNPYSNVHKLLDYIDRFSANS